MTVQEIYDIFVDYYKEENTDLQGDKIYIKWDSVNIKNETGAMFTIHGLYGCITLKEAYPSTRRGEYFMYSITFNKSIYTYNEWYHGYIHSHVQRLFHSDPRTFMGCCLGSGPLSNTYWNLKSESDPLKWELLCWELDKYVTVESLAGGPYMKFSSLSLTTSSLVNKFEINRSKFCNTEPDITKFIVDNIEIPFSYSDKQWKLGDTFENIVFKINDAVIKAINKRDIIVKDLNHTFQDYIIRNNNIYEYRSRFEEITPPENMQLFVFKGNPVMLRVLGSTEITNAKVKLLSMHYINSLLTEMIFYLNYGYQKDITNDKRVFIKV